tara:strand:+ start:5256 stop:14153 length:8898 start_codon:yes stop_codon:yes gene_type:complete
MADPSLLDLLAKHREDKTAKAADVAAKPLENNVVPLQPAQPLAPTVMGPTVAEANQRFGPPAHPATQQVLNNINLTKDMNPTDEAKYKAIAKAGNMPLEVARNIHPAMMDNWMERQDTQAYLEQASATRKRMAVDAEAALVLRGEIPYLAASEQALDTLGLEIMLPYKQPVRRKASLPPEEQSIAAGIGRQLLNSVIRFGQIIPREIKRENLLEQIIDANRTGGEVIEDWYNTLPNEHFSILDMETHKLSGRSYVPGPGDLFDGARRLVNWLTANPEDVAEHTEEALAISRELVKLHKATSIGGSTYAKTFGDRIGEIDPDATQTERAALMLNAIVDMPGEAIVFTTEVVANQAVPLIAGAAATYLTKRPLAGVLTSSAGGYVQERFNDYDADLIKKFGPEASLLTEGGMREFLASPERQSFVQGIGEDRALVITLANLLGFKIAGTRLAKGSMANMALQVPVAAISEGGGEAAAGVYSGQGFDSVEAILEMMGGGITAPITVFTAVGEARTDKKAARDAAAWLKTGEEISSHVGNIAPEALTTAAEVLADKLKSEGITTVHLSAEEVIKFDQDSIAGASVAETLGLDPNDLTEAAANGQDVEIGAEAFVRHILGKEGFDGLIKHTRMTVEGMTPAEADAFSEAEGDIDVQMLQGKLEKALGVTEEAGVSLRSDAEDIAADVRSQMMDIGRGSREGDLAALLTARRYVARAVRASAETGEAISALEMYIEDNVVISKEAGPTNAAQTLMQPGMPAFDEWFGGSQVANADGSPTVVYHGTSSDVDAFNEETRASFFGRGTYFTPDPKLASGYAGEEAGANVMPVYLSIANPYEVNQKDNKVFTTMGALRDQIRKDFGETAIEEIGGVEDISQFYEGVTQWLRDKGYDGISSSVAGSPASFIAFDPTQIKSVNNKGTFAATNPMVLNQTQALAQRFTSGKTSRRQVAATFKAKVFKPGTVNLDLGGGKFDDGTNYLEAQGVENLVFDPVNRDAAHNQGVLDKLIAGVQPETVTVNNVLNVVAEAEVRSGIIQQAGRAVADRGVVYFKIYEGDKKGKGKETKDGFQNNAKAATYMAEIKEHFGTVTRSGDILVATDPIDSGPAAWFTQLDGTGERVLFQDAPVAVANEMVIKAQAALKNLRAPKGGMGSTSVTRLYNEKFEKERGDDGRLQVRKGYRKSVLEVATEFHAERVEGRDTWTDANAKVIGKLMAIEAAHAITQDGNAATWYRDKVEGALKVASLVHPEIETDVRAATAFRFILAVTSNGSTVSENSSSAFAVYDSIGMTDYLPGGSKHNQPIRIPPAGFGKEVGAMKLAFETWNKHVTEMGVDNFIEFLNTDFTAGELKQMGYEVSGELVTEPVKGSVIIGSKIGGGFFQNLEGNFDSLTMDLWFMRSWGRWSGSLIPQVSEQTKTERFDRLRDVLSNEKERKRSKLGVDLPTVDAVAKMSEEQLITTAASILRADSVDRGNGTFAKTVSKKGKDGKMKKVRAELHLASQRVAEGAKKVLDAPAGGGHRNFMRQAAREAMAVLQLEGIDVALADLQALLWYPEKDLYTIMGSGTKRTAPTDYETEFALIAKRKGITDDDIKAAVLPRVDGDGTGSGAATDTIKQQEDAGSTQSQGQGAKDGSVTLDQTTANASARGQFTPASQITDQNGNLINLIQIFEAGDRSTFLHESGHFWLEQLKSDAVKFGGGFDNDFKVVKKWWASNADSIRAESLDRARRNKDQGAVDAISAMTDAAIQTYVRSGNLTGSGHTRYLSVAMHEQWARGAEAYFKTGKAPSIALMDAFIAFAAWIRSVYASLTRISGRDQMDVQFSSEVTEVMDRMLATDAEIEMVASQFELASLFDTAEQAGMTKKQFAAHNEDIARQKEAAKITQLSKRMQKIERERLAWWKEEREAMRDAVRSDLAQTPAFKLVWAITQGTRADGSPLGSGEAVNRIDKAALKKFTAQDGMPALSELPRATGRAIYEPSKKGEPAGTTSPGLVANIFGYGTVEEMLLDLAAQGDYQTAVETEMDTRMREKHGDIDDAAIDAAIASIHEQDGIAKTMATELAALRTSEKAINPKFVKAYAAEKILNTKVGLASPRAYLAAEKRHAKAAGKALRKGDRSLAYTHQFQRLINHYMAAEAQRLKSVRDKQLSYIRKFQQGRKKWPGIEADYVDAIRAKVNIHNLGSKTSTKKRIEAEQAAFTDFLARAKEDDGAIFDIPEWIKAKDKLVHFRDLTVGEFKELHDVVKQLERQGRNAKKLIMGDEALERDVLVAKMLERLNAKPIATAVKARGRHISNSSFASKVADIDAGLLKTELLLEMIDGEPLGVWHQSIYQPFANAEAFKQDLGAEVAKLVSDRMNALPKETLKAMGKRVDIGEMAGTEANADEQWTRGNLLVLALNVGNESNLGKLIRGEQSVGRNISEELVDSALSQLSKEEWDLIQDIWDYAEKLWPSVEQIYRKEYGRVPDRVEARAVVTPHGTYRGGYFPLMYDSSRSPAGNDLESMDALEAFQSEHVRGTVNSSMTKERSEGFSAPINFDVQKIASSFDKTIHFISHYEAVRNANRILGHPALKAAMQIKLGPSYVKALKEWVGSIASNGYDRPPTAGVEAVVGVIARNTTVAVLGLSYSTLTAQLLGYTTAIDRLMVDGNATYGADLPATVRDLAVGMQQAMSTEHRAAVIKLSGEMRHRINNTDRDLRSGLRSVKGEVGLNARFAEFSMLTIGAMQLYFVDFPVWTAAYNRALREEQGDVPRAVAYADRVVRQSQSAGGLKDLATVQRNKGYGKLGTMFYSFFSLLYGITRSVGHEAVLKNPTSIPRIIARLAVIITLSELGYGLMRGELPDLEPEDEDEDGMVKWLAKKTIGGIAAGVPFGRDVVEGMLGDYGYSMSPTAMFGESVAESFNIAADSMDYYFNSDSEEEPPELKDIKPVVLALGIMLKFPAIQANRTLSGVFALLEEEEDASFFDLLIGYKPDEE